VLGCENAAKYHCTSAVEYLLSFRNTPMAGAALAVSVVALVLTGLGWFVNSWLNARTQRQALVNSLTNDARVTLTDAIRDLHDWCVEMQTLAASMPVDDITSLGQTSEHHESRKRELVELSTDSRHFVWLRRLEEYESLFPGTASVRVELLNILMAACNSARQLALRHAPGSPPPNSDLDLFGKGINDILALTWDLLIYLQNVSIGQITGNEIRERQPLDPTSIRLIADERGCLAVCRPR
jgi:hypothetical protein